VVLLYRHRFFQASVDNPLIRMCANPGCCYQAFFHRNRPDRIATMIPSYGLLSRQHATARRSSSTGSMRMITASKWVQQAIGSGSDDEVEAKRLIFEHFPSNQDRVAWLNTDEHQIAQRDISFMVRTLGIQTSNASKTSVLLARPD